MLQHIKLQRVTRPLPTRCRLARGFLQILPICSSRKVYFCPPERRKLIQIVLDPFPNA